MIGLDTNLIVRFLTHDDAVQARQAAKLMNQQHVFLTKTVLLETEWVLRYSYQLSAPVIHASLIKLLGVSTVTVEDTHGVAQALAWYAGGMDFADALHLAAGRRHVQAFYTFDRALGKQAMKLKANPPVLHPGQSTPSP